MFIWTFFIIRLHFCAYTLIYFFCRRRRRQRWFLVCIFPTRSFPFFILLCLPFFLYFFFLIYIVVCIVYCGKWSSVLFAHICDGIKILICSRRYYKFISNANESADDNCDGEKGKNRGDAGMSVGVGHASWVLFVLRKLDRGIIETAADDGNGKYSRMEWNKCVRNK